MGVPNTTTFSLADVIAVVNPTSRDLNDCFSDASSASFNTTYDEDKDELDDFRDYGNNGGSQTLVQIANNGYITSNVCSQSYNHSVFKSGAANFWENGNKLWYNNFGSAGSPFVGNPTNPDLEWYSGGNGLNKRKFQINPSGIVYNVSSCSSYLTLVDVSYMTSISPLTWSTEVDYYYDSAIGDASNLKARDRLYTDTALTQLLQGHNGYSPYSENQYFQNMNTVSSQHICTDPNGAGTFSLTNDVDGIISYSACAFF